jgi:hypothetical protein
MVVGEQSIGSVMTVTPSVSRELSTGSHAKSQLVNWSTAGFGPVPGAFKPLKLQQR